jgi:hypothetical protein
MGTAKGEGLGAGVQDGRGGYWPRCLWGACRIWSPGMVTVDLSVSPRTQVWTCRGACPGGLWGFAEPRRGHVHQDCGSGMPENLLAISGVAVAGGLSGKLWAGVHGAAPG